MKTEIHTIQDALVYQLTGLLYSETKVAAEFSACSSELTQQTLKDEISKYIESGHDKQIKLERIFNYLMHEPIARKNEVINKLIDETKYLLSATESAHLKNILMAGCIQNINAYKIAGYKTAYIFCVELELDTPADLIQQILEWELATAKTLGPIAIEEFNKIERIVKTD